METGFSVKLVQPGKILKVTSAKLYLQSAVNTKDLLICYRSLSGTLAVGYAFCVLKWSFDGFDFIFTFIYVLECSLTALLPFSPFTSL